MYYFLLKEYKSKARPGLLLTAKLMIQGFISESWYIYNFKNNSKKDYLSDYSRLKTKFINKEYEVVLNNKLIFQSIMSPKVEMPKIFGVIQNGRLFESHDLKIGSIKKLQKLIDTNKKLIFKPISTGGGRGILLVEKNNHGLKVNRKNINWSVFQKLISTLNNYIICEFVEQADFLKKIFPYSTNTLRIVFFKNVKTGKCELAKIIHRFGGKVNQPTDNWSQGGLSVDVDINNKTFGKAAFFDASNKSLKFLSKHPVTKQQIEGIKISGLNHIIDKLQKLSNDLVYIKYIGWDVVITNEGFSVIEANNFTDVNLLQVHKPLLINDNLKEFYKYYRII